MEINNQEQVPQAIQDVIQATVDRAIATLLESGLLDCKLKHKKRSRSRSRSKGKKDKKKGKKRSSSSSSSSSDSDDDKKSKGKKGKGRKRSRSRSHSRRRRSHSRGPRSRSGSRSKSHHHKRGWHHDPDAMLFYHHYFNCPYTWNEEGESRRQKHEGGRKGHKKHWKKNCQTTDDEHKDKTLGSSEKETDLSKEFENLDVVDKEKCKE